MAFRINSSQQLSLTDITNSLTLREQKALENSWAKIFAEDIFPAIDEERFRILYSDRTQSKFNTPVNICIGALIIKEMFQISDDEIVENLMLDPRYQYALHTTSFEEQPMSDKTLSRFRKRCYDYEQETGIDLIHDCVADLSGKIAKMMKINPRIHRMDSLMIEANIKNLSRTELLYSCIAKLARRLHKLDRGDVLEAFSIITTRMILTVPSIIVTVPAQRISPRCSCGMQILSQGGAGMVWKHRRNTVCWNAACLNRRLWRVTRAGFGKRKKTVFQKP